MSSPRPDPHPGSTSASPPATATATAAVSSAHHAPTSPTTPGPAPPSPSTGPQPQSLPHRLWSLRVPLCISCPSAPDPQPADFVVSVPRFSYLAQLLPKLSLYFKAPCSGFRYEDIHLRSLCVGLLADLYTPTLPWRVEVVDDGGWDIRDTFLNSVKEADFVRNGNARAVMGMGVGDTEGLWGSVVNNNYEAYAAINHKLLHPPNPIKHVPIRLYIPTSPSAKDGSDEPAAAGSFRVMQSLVPLSESGAHDGGARKGIILHRRSGSSSRTGAERGARTLGAALKSMVPTLFPSSRDPVLANAVLHGAPLPLAAPLDELMREAAYPDGWLNLVVALL